MKYLLKVIMISLVILNLIAVFIIIIIITIIKLFIDDYRFISKKHSVSEYKIELLRVNKPNKQTVSPFDGGRTTFKESKSKSLVRYDFIKLNSIKNN